jgi:hypothetical protein
MLGKSANIKEQLKDFIKLLNSQGTRTAYLDENAEIACRRHFLMENKDKA